MNFISKNIRKVSVCLLIGLAGCSSAPTDPIVDAPLMGWNSFDSYGVYCHEKAAFDNMRVMAEQYKPYGYTYFTIDNGWFGEYKLRPGTMYAAEKHASDIRINEFGLLQPSKTYFPNGLSKLIDECHKLGLKFGVHLMRGIPRKAVELNTPIKGTNYHARDIADTTSVCNWCLYNYGVDMSKPGAQEFYNSLIEQLADWGVDFIKYDDIVPFPDEVEAVVKAIKNSKRNIVLSLSPGNELKENAFDTYHKADMLRVTGDIWDNRYGIFACFKAWKKWNSQQKEGFWIDMDMIPFGKLQLMSPKMEGDENAIRLAGKGNTRESELTPSEKRVFITLRALSASPLIIGGDLPTMDKYSYELLTNKHMLEANQNGIMGHLVSEKDKVQIWSTPQKKGKGGWIGIFNLADEPTVVDTDLNVMTDKYPCKKIYDVWNKKVIATSELSSLQVPAFDVIFLRYE